jgi:hypothetical protein
LFFGTPHFGSAWASLHSKLLYLRGIFTPTTSHIARLLAKNSTYLDRLQVEFAAISGNVAIVCFYEELAMNTTVGLVSASTPISDLT